MYMRPCRTCRFDGVCGLQEHIRDHLVPMPQPDIERLTWTVTPTLVNFRCDWRLEDLEPGRICRTMVKDYIQTHPDDGEYRSRWALVTIMGQQAKRRGGRLICFLHPHENNEREVILRWPKQLDPTEAADELCETCGRPMWAEPPPAFDSNHPDRWSCECGTYGRHVTAAEIEELAEVPDDLFFEAQR